MNNILTQTSQTYTENALALLVLPIRMAARAKRLASVRFVRSA